MTRTELQSRNDASALGVDQRRVLAEIEELERTLNLRSAVRDDPRRAADVLRELGYQVNWLPGYGEPAPYREDLRGP
jgi:hypothetical protein